MRPKEEFPNLAHWRRVKGQHQLLSSFVEWLEDNGAEIEFPGGCNLTFPTLDSMRKGDVIDNYLKVDRQKIDVELKVLLDRQFGEDDG